MRYLISGVAGFLGSNLALRLLLEDHTVVGFDNMISGDQYNVRDLRDRYPNRFECFCGLDVRDLEQMKCKLSGKFDYVLNLACPASPKKYYAGNEILTMQTCSLGTENMIKFALRDGARFFHTSTSEVYGDPEVHPQDEGYPGKVTCDAHRSVYDEGKRYAEALINAYRKLEGLNAGVVRLFNTYGPRMNPDDGRVVSTFILQALRGEPLTIEGDGSHTRSFAYVDDTIDGIMRMIHSDVQIPVNIGNPDEWTVRQLALSVIQMTGSRSQIVYGQEATSDPKRRKPDISRAIELLGWKPGVMLEDGLNSTINWFRHY